MKQKEVSKGRRIGNIISMIVIMAVIGGIGAGGVYIYNSMQDKTAYREEGIAYYNAGDYDNAIKKLDSSLKQKAFFAEPLDRDTRLYLADSYYLSKQYQKAIKQYDILLETEEEQVAYLTLQKQMCQAFIDFNNSKYESALPAFQTAIEAGHVECTLYAGVCAAELGKSDEMVAYLTTYLSYNPDNAYACTMLADYYLKQGVYETCHQYLLQGLNGSDRSCDEQLLYVEVVYYEYMHEYNTAYERLCEYMETYPVTDAVQREYDFLSTRQTLES